MLLEKAVKVWTIKQRLLFPDSLLTRVNTFVLVEPLSVSAEMFPMVFWCQNQRCGRISDRFKSGISFILHLVQLVRQGG